MKPKGWKLNPQWLAREEAKQVAYWKRVSERRLISAQFDAIIANNIILQRLENNEKEEATRVVKENAFANERVEPT